MTLHFGWAMVGVLAIASLGGCGPKTIDLSGANYVGSGNATVDLKVGDALATFGKAAAWDAIRINEVGKNGSWFLDFNDVDLTAGATLPAKAYVSIEFLSRPTVGTVRARVTTEIYKPNRTSGERVKSTSKDTEVTLEKAELVKGGALAGRIELSSEDMVVQGSFDLRLDDAPSLLPAK